MGNTLTFYGRQYIKVIGLDIKWWQQRQLLRAEGHELVNTAELDRCYVHNSTRATIVNSNCGMSTHIKATDKRNEIAYARQHRQ